MLANSVSKSANRRVLSSITSLRYVSSSSSSSSLALISNSSNCPGCECGGNTSSITTSRLNTFNNNTNKLIPSSSIRRHQYSTISRLSQIKSNSFSNSSATFNITNNNSSKIGTRYYSAITLDEPAPVIDFTKTKEIVTSAPFDDKEYVIVDVREPGEYAAGFIPHALNIPYKSTPGALGLEPEEFQETFGFPKPDPEKNLLFYCLGGVRSTAAETLAATFGYQK